MRTRNALLCLALAAGAVLVGAVPAAAATQPGSPCSNATVSAQNQYCEDIPSATGGGEALPGTPALARHLPPAEVAALRGGGAGASGSSGGSGGRGSTPSASGAHSAAARTSDSARTRQALLTLPAPTSRVPFAGTVSPRPSTASLFSGLIIALVVATLATGGFALVRRARGGGP
jgi:hypothetical protein